MCSAHDRLCRWVINSEVAVGAKLLSFLSGLGLDRVPGESKLVRVDAEHARSVGQDAVAGAADIVPRIRKPSMRTVISGAVRFNM